MCCSKIAVISAELCDACKGRKLSHLASWLLGISPGKATNHGNPDHCMFDYLLPRSRHRCLISTFYPLPQHSEDPGGVWRDDLVRREEDRDGGGRGQIVWGQLGRHHKDAPGLQVSDHNSSKCRIYFLLIQYIRDTIR